MSDGAGNTIAQYAYDPFGRRIAKTVNGTTTYYMYSDEGLLAEFDGAGKQQVGYGFAPGGTWGTGPVFMRTAGGYYFYHNDALGTPQQMTAVDGAVVWSAKAQAFGRTTVASASTVVNNLRFPGQYYDAETGLHYNYFRDYDPSIGRYIESDPIGLHGGLNTYAYVASNPLSNIDQQGLAIWEVVDAFDASMVAGVGGQYTMYKLKSPCNSQGKKFTITVQAVGPSAGLGLKCKACFTAPVKVPLGGSFDDHSSEPNPGAFNGPFLSVNAGAQFMGFGGGGSDVLLGRATSVGSLGMSLGFGTIGAEVSGTIGTSTVTNIETEECECEK